MRTAEITIRLHPEDVQALNRATADLKKLAATRPRSLMRAIRLGMALQRAIDALTARNRPRDRPRRHL